MSRVDGDDLSGICYVGSQDVESLRGFVSIPLLVHLGLGGLFLLLGFVNLFRIRKSIKKVRSEHFAICSRAVLSLNFAFACKDILVL